MSTSALELERRNLEAQITNAELRMAEGVAARDPSAASIAQSELLTVRARLDRVLERIGEATVRAPHAGIVVAPELADLPGRVVAVGDPMVAIAEDGSLALELRVPQSRVSDLEVGSRLRFASHARPELPGFSTLQSVAPATVQREGRSVFVADAALPEDQAWLRPGMEGVAMVEAGERPNWWLAVHRLVDKARLSFWFE
jgi:multidrug resistance efflux pump